ncbi:MAG: sulfite exporter TauE/SafE family protein [Spirochaetota bacterium]
MVDRIKLTVKGMTCQNCEHRIEKTVQALPGIIKAEASYARGTAIVEFDSGIISPVDIKKAVEAAGYAVAEGEKPGRASADSFTALQLAGIAVILAALFLIARQTGIFNRLPVIEQSMGYGILFVIGLITSIHCIAMCGGINLSQSVPKTVPVDTKVISRIKPGLLYNGGRVLSYTVIGGIAGAAGSAVHFSPVAQAIIVIIAGVFMIIMGINMLNIIPSFKKVAIRLPKSFSRRIDRLKEGKGPFIVGILNGFMPCGPLQSMQLYALGTGSFISGAFSMFTFSAGTVPLMMGFGAISSLLSKKFHARILKISALLVILLGGGMLTRGFSLSGISIIPGTFGNKVNTKNIAYIQDNAQYVETAFHNSEYEPIIIQAGMPVKWTINVEEGTLNGCNNPITIPALQITKRLLPGKNEIEFTPQAPGDIIYTCWMGMIASTIRVVPDLKKVTTGDLAAVREKAVASSGSCCSGTTASASGGQSCCSSGGTGEGIPPINFTGEGITILTEKIEISKLIGNKQYINLTVDANGYSPSILVLQQGIEARWNLSFTSFDEKNYRMVIPAYNTRIEFAEKENSIEFIPERDFIFSSWKGDYNGYVKVVEDISTVNMDSIRSEVKALSKKKL